MAAGSSMKLPTWYRVLAVIVGVFSIGLALVVLVEPLLAIWLLIFFLALALLMMGVDRLVAGVTGHAFGQMVPIVPAILGGTPPSTSSGAPPGTGERPKN